MEKTYGYIIDGDNKTPKQIFFPKLLPTQLLDETPLHKASYLLSTHNPSLSSLILMPYSFMSKKSSNIEFIEPSLVMDNVNHRKLLSQYTTTADMMNHGVLMDNPRLYFPFYLQSPVSKVKYKAYESYRFGLIG